MNSLTLIWESILIKLLKNIGKTNLSAVSIDSKPNLSGSWKFFLKDWESLGYVRLICSFFSSKFLIKYAIFIKMFASHQIQNNHDIYYQS